MVAVQLGDGSGLDWIWWIILIQAGSRRCFWSQIDLGGVSGAGWVQGGSGSGWVWGDSGSGWVWGGSGQGWS